jgi:hypothetical protein
MRFYHTLHANRKGELNGSELVLGLPSSDKDLDMSDHIKMWVARGYEIVHNVHQVK